MKRYLLIDLLTEYKEIMSFRELKGFLIDHITGDTIDNRQEEDIVITNVNVLGNIAKNDINLQAIIEQLNSYSYKVIDLLDIQRDLEDLKDYFEKDNLSADFNRIIEKINGEVK